MKAVEWYESCDYDEDDLAKYIEEYRRGEAKKNDEQRGNFNNNSN